MDLEQLAARLARLEAFEGAQHTLREYAVEIDCGHWDTVGGLFTEDARLEVVGYGSLEGVDYDGAWRGRQAIRDYYAGNNPDHVGPPRSKHNILQGPIQLDGDDELTMLAYFDMPPKTPGNPGGGVYEARLRREDDGRWRFAHLRIVSTGETPVLEAISGEV